MSGSADSGVVFLPGSYRDRSARVCLSGDRVLRALTGEAAAVWQQLQPSDFWRQICQQGLVVATTEAEGEAAWAVQQGYQLVLQHERIGLISWPWEWSFSMLRDAALLQLSLLQQALPAGFDLADATPFNFQFRGASVQFMDVGSFRLRQPTGLWEGYRQFCEQFLAPLLLQAWKQMDFQPLLRGRMTGIPLRQMAGLLSWRDLLFRRGALTHIWLHSRVASVMQRRRQQAGSDELSTEMILSNLRGLQRVVQSLQWTPADSAWQDYYETAAHATAHEAEKSQFVSRACSQFRPDVTWDLGCNEGRYSRIAAEWGTVLALDADHAVIDRLYRRLAAEPRDCVFRQRITPLVFNLADPSPSQGWRLQERMSLLARSQPRLVLCLAVIHHLVLGCGLLLEDVVRWLAELQVPVVFEWVDREDPLVCRMLQQRQDVFTDYSEERLRGALRGVFQVGAEQCLSEGHRKLLLLLPVTAGDQA